MDRYLSPNDVNESWSSCAFENENSSKVSHLASRTISIAPIIVAYYTASSIYSRGYFVNDVPAEKITHVNYAFAKIDDDGCIALGDPSGDVDKPFNNARWDQPLHGNFSSVVAIESQASTSSNVDLDRQMGTVLLVSLLSVKDDCLDMVRQILRCRSDEWKSSEICPIVRGIRGEVCLRWCWSWLVSLLSVSSVSFVWVCSSREHSASGGLPENARRPEDKANHVLLLKELR